MNRLLCFGLGYSALTLTKRLIPDGWKVLGTVRDPDQARSIMRARADVAASLVGHEILRFDRDHPLAATDFAEVSHVLISIPPEESGDPALDVHAADIAAMPNLRWLGYLSTTGVYGDRSGAWVDETSELRPTGERGRRRVTAEAGWLDLWRRHRVPVHVFRLAGIYGPGSNPFGALRYGTARRLERPGQLFSRIHVDDLAQVLAASIDKPRPGAIYNVCDDEPAAQADVAAYAAGLLGVPPPPLMPFDTPHPEMTPLARSFWDDNKRVSNALIKQELGVRLRYPNYRVGLAAILAAGG